jgi:hypothetical protein
MQIRDVSEGKKSNQLMNGQISVEGKKIAMERAERRKQSLHGDQITT